MKGICSMTEKESTKKVESETKESSPEENDAEWTSLAESNPSLLFEIMNGHPQEDQDF